MDADNPMIPICVYLCLSAFICGFIHRISRFRPFAFSRQSAGMPIKGARHRMASPIRVAITGASGQVTYGLLPRVAAGEMFGPDQPVIMQLFDVPSQIEK